VIVKVITEQLEQVTFLEAAPYKNDFHKLPFDIVVMLYVYIYYFLLYLYYHLW